MVAFERRLQPIVSARCVSLPRHRLLDLYRRVVQTRCWMTIRRTGRRLRRSRRLAVLATEAPVAARHSAAGVRAGLAAASVHRSAPGAVDQKRPRIAGRSTAANKTATVGPQFARSRITVGIKGDDPVLRSDLAEVAAETSVPRRSTRPGRRRRRADCGTTKVTAGAGTSRTTTRARAVGVRRSRPGALTGPGTRSAAHCTDQAHRNAAAYDARGFLARSARCLTPRPPTWHRHDPGTATGR